MNEISLILTVTLNPAIDITIKTQNLNMSDFDNIKPSSIDPGGKGVNISKALTKLSISSIATGLLPKNNSEKFLTYLKQIKIEESFYRLNFGKVRENYKLIEINSGKLKEINEKGLNSNQISLEILNNFHNHYENLLNDVQAVVISGSLPTGIKEEFYLKLIETAFTKRLIIGFDSNKKPLLHVLNNNLLPNIVHINKMELEELGYNFSFISISNLFEKLNLEWFIVSNGNSYGLAVSKLSSYRFIPPKIKSNSPVACGDAFLAALIEHKLKNESFEKSLRFAIAFASATAEIPGSGIATKEHALRLINKVSMIKIN